MGESIKELVVNLAAIGLLFYVIIKIRNKIEYSNKYKTFKKTDGFILMLLIYLFLFFAPTNIRSLDINVFYSLPAYHQIPVINWIPFTWISEQFEFLEFYRYIDLRPDYYQNFGATDLVGHYIKFVVHLLPLSYFSYAMTWKKWFGLVIAELTGIVVVLLNFGQFLGDALIVIVMTYLLIMVIGFAFNKLVNVQLKLDKKRQLMVTYIIGFSLMLVGCIFVLTIQFGNYYGDEKLVGTIKVNESYDVYDGLVTLDLTHVSLYTGGYFGESIKLNGKLKVDESLSRYFSSDIENEVYTRYSYSFYGNDYAQGTNVVDFSKIDESKNGTGLYMFQQYVELSNYGTYNLRDNGLYKRNKDDLSKKFFELKGLSKLTLSTNQEDLESFYEVLESQIGKDQYMYIENTYKVLKFNGQDIIYDLGPSGVDENGDYIRFYAKEEEVIEETNEYKIIKEKSYIYKSEDLDLDSIEVNASRGSLSFDLKEGQTLLTFDKEDFND